MAEAPKPIISAQSKPRLAPSLMMVTLTGPTGTERRKPLRNPVNAARRKGWTYISTRRGAALFFFLVFDFVPDLARNARANEAVEQVNREHQRQDDGKNEPPQKHQAGDADDEHHGSREASPRLQVERLEGRILDFADHHEGQEQKDTGQEI